MEQATINSIAEAGARVYASLRGDIEPRLNGKYIVIDVDTGHYEIDADRMAASDRAHAQWPHGRSR